jgi:hypothetical protein
MIDYIKTVLASQHVAALRMIQDAVTACPADRWAEAVGTKPFGSTAYHAVFFADMYLSPSESDFALGDVHRVGGDLRRTGFGTGLSPAETVAYADQVRRKAAEAMAAETAESLRGPCGFSWLQITRGELHIYNTRHVQHHAGALGAFLRRCGVGTSGPDPVDWVDHADFPSPPRFGVGPA